MTSRLLTQNVPANTGNMPESESEELARITAMKGQRPTVAAPPQVDRRKAFWNGYMSDLSANLSQNYRPMTTGGLAQTNADNTNYDRNAAYTQIQQGEFDEQQKRGDELEKKRQVASGYTDWFRNSYKKNGKAPEVSMNTWLGLTDSAREGLLNEATGLGATNTPSKDAMNYRLMQDLKDIADDPESTKEEKKAAQESMDLFFAVKRAGSIQKVGDVNTRYNQRTGKLESIDEQDRSIQEQQDQYTINEIDKAAGITQAQKIAGYNVELDGALRTKLVGIDERLTRLQRLRDRVEAAPATGRVEQLSAAWDAEMQATDSLFNNEAWNTLMGMKEQGMTFGNLTEKEFERVASTIGSIGNKRDANLQILDRLISDVGNQYDLIHERHTNPEAYMLGNSRKVPHRRDRKPAAKRKDVGSAIQDIVNEDEGE